MLGRVAGKAMKDLDKILDKQKKLNLAMQKLQGDQKKMKEMMKAMEQLMKAQADAQKAIIKDLK